MNPVRVFTLTRLLFYPHRTPLTRTPPMPYEDVAFAATDGVRLRGWFVTAGSGAPTVVLVHGWMWNRLGNVAGPCVHDRPGTNRVRAPGDAVPARNRRETSRSSRI